MTRGSGNGDLSSPSVTVLTDRSGAVKWVSVPKKIHSAPGGEKNALMESLDEGVAVLALDGTATYCNELFARSLGLPPDGLAGASLEDYVEAESSAAFAALLGGPEDACGLEELRLATPAGRSLIVRASRRCLDFGDSREVGVVLVDITESKRMESKGLRLSRLYATLSAVNQAIVHTVDRDSLFRNCCRAAVDLGEFLLAWVGFIDPETKLVNVDQSYGETGYLDGIRISARQDPEGLGPTGIAVREGTYYICNDFLDSEITRPWHDRARAHGIRASASIVLRLGGEAVGALTLYSGERDFFDAEHVALLREMGDDLSFGLELLHDRELRQKAERALCDEAIAHERTAQALRDKEQALIDQSRQAAMGAMIDNIAHQWRQPLNSLGITIQKLLLYRDRGEIDQHQLRQSVGNSMDLIRHMSQTIDDFRDFFRPNREKTEFDARASIGKTLSLLAATFEAQHIEVAFEEGENVELLGYPNEFAQALINIIINAKDELLVREVVEPRIEISLRKEGAKAVIQVADNAGGIPEEIMDKIFDPYFTTKGAQGGTGLGLPMSRTIIEKNMGGRLSVRNGPTGAEFRIEI